MPENDDFARMKEFINYAIEKKRNISQEEEYELIERWQKGKDINARNKLVESFAYLTINPALFYSRRYGIPARDLVNEGILGLERAANKFEISKDLRFSTFAGYKAVGAIKDYVIKNSDRFIVSRGREGRKIIFNSKSDDSDDNDSDDNVYDTSLDNFVPGDEKGKRFIDTLPDKDSYDIENLLAQALTTHAFTDTFNYLPLQDRRLVECLLLDIPKIDIAGQEGVESQTIKYREGKLYKKIRKIIETQFGEEAIHDYVYG